MNIAFFVNAFPKISETFILDQITGMLDRGHEIDIYARHPSGEERIHTEVGQYDLLSRTIYANPPDGKTQRLLSAASTVIKNVPSRPRRILESLRVGKYDRDALSLRLLHSAMSFDDSNYDILYCHFGPNGNLGALLKRTGVSSPIVTAFHGFDVRRARSKNDLYLPAFDESDVLLANSRQTQEELHTSGADPSKTQIHRIGVDLSRYSMSSDSGRNSDPFSILTIARLVEEKDLRTSIQAVAELLESDIDEEIRYHIIGSGPEKGELKRFAAELGIQDSVIFEGQRSRTEVIERLSATDVFLLTSIEEGFGKVLIEAQASGVPVVATDVGGIPEAVCAGESGTLVPGRDPRAVAESIAKILRRPKLREKMGRAGREFVEERFDVVVLNDELEQLFESLTEGR